MTSSGQNSNAARLLNLDTEFTELSRAFVLLIQRQDEKR